MFELGSPVPGLLLATMILITLLLLPYIDAEPARRQHDMHPPQSTEELRLRAEAIARARGKQGK